MNRAPESDSRNSETPVEEIRGLPSSRLDGTETVPSLKKKSRGILVERPGESAGSWEQWLLAPGHPVQRLPETTTLQGGVERLLCLPSSSLYAWPLWVANEGESMDLVLLELSGRHLLKRGMEGSLAILPVLRNTERQLLLAVAAEEPFPVESMPQDWKKASRFELPARLLAGSLTHDLILWKEWGELQVAFYRNQQPVWFCTAGSQDITGLIHRIALRLLAEGVLEHLPATILLNAIPEQTANRCRGLTALFPGARITDSDTNNLIPELRKDLFDVVPAEARAERNRFHHWQKLLSLAIAGALLYLLLLLWGSGDLLIKQAALKRLHREIASVEQPALAAQQEANLWRSLRPAIDPDTYPLDLLAAVAAPTEGGKVRLIQFSLDQGHLHLTGEATDVTQAYNAIDQIKKNPLLQAYDWATGQPQLAGKNSVRFDMEGTRADTSHEATGPK